MWFLFQASETSSSSQIFFRRGWSIFNDDVGFTLSALGGMPSGHPSLPFFIVHWFFCHIMN